MLDEHSVHDMCKQNTTLTHSAGGGLRGRKEKEINKKAI